VKKNNFYFFEKGTQMKGKANQNLFEKCFSKNFEKDSGILTHNPKKIDLFTDEFKSQKQTNSLESVFLNSFTLKQNKTPQKITLEHLKLKTSYQESNKIFGGQKIKKRTPFKLHLGHNNNPLVLFKYIPSTCS